MQDKNTFLKEYNIEEKEFEEAHIAWEEIEKIYENYTQMEEKLRSIGKDFVDE